MTSPTITSLLNPQLVNLHRQCTLALANLAPLIANEMRISVGQAKLLITHSIDAGLVFLLKKYNDNPQAIHLQSNHLSHHAKLHQTLHGNRLDTHIFHNIPKQSCEQLFLDKSEEVVRRLSLTAKVPTHIAKQVASIVATLCQHHLEVLATDSKLEYGEKKEWLALQPIFLQKYAPTELWAAIAQTTLTAPTLKTGDIRVKLGLKESAFDQSEIALPNLPWLINLAHIAEQKYQKPLAIGQIAHPHDPVFDEKLKSVMAELSANITNDPKKSVAKSAKLPPKQPENNSPRFAWLISGAVMACALLVFAVPKLFGDKPPAQAVVAKTTAKPANDTKIEGLGHQDIAVVRVKDDKKNETTAKTTNNQANAKAEQSAKDQKRAEQLKAEQEKTKQAKAEQAIKAKLAQEKADKAKAEKARAERLAAQKAEITKAEQAKKDNKIKADQKTEKAKKAQAEKARADRLAEQKAEQAKQQADKAKAEKAKAELAKAEKAKASKKEPNKTVAETRPKTDTKAKTDTKPKPKPAQTNAALTTMQVNPTPKIEPAKSAPKSDGLTTLSIQQSTSPAPTASDIKPANSERKNKNKNNGEPIINQDTIGKLGNDGENGN